MKTQLAIFLFPFLFVLSTAAQTPITYVYLDRENNSNVFDKKYYIIRSLDEWNKIKERTVVRNKETLKAIEEIDFSKQALLLYFAGDQCNDVELGSLDRTLFEIAIHIQHLSYDSNCPNAKLLVTPWLLIRFNAKPDINITLTENIKLVHCP